MKTLQILMPMGGLGSRFREKGFEVPKPLINVNGQAMFLIALSSFDAYKGPKKYIFVVRRDAESINALGTRIKDLIPDSTVVYLEENTRGAVETCLTARQSIDPELPLTIMDCDFSFMSNNYFEKVNEMIKGPGPDGVLLSFDSKLDRYSYARVDENENVLETAEKNPISSNALAGAYSFANGRLFLDAAEKLLTHPINEKIHEYYLSLIYNILIDENKVIHLAKTDIFNSFGTPEELASYLEGLKK